MRTVLFADPQHRLLPDAVAQLRRLGDLVVAGGDEDEDAVCAGADLVVSFLSRRILRGHALDLPNFNLHPASPLYPGVGGASRALFDGVQMFGACAHAMEREVDAGRVVNVQWFSVQSTDTCESLFSRAEVACVQALADVSEHFARRGALPDPTSTQWEGEAMRRADFERWLTFDPRSEEPSVLERKIAAARHSWRPGPYVLVNGHRFGL